MDFSSVKILKPFSVHHSKVKNGLYIRLFQVAVSNIVTTPVWHCVELNAVGELHICGACW